MRRVLLAIAAVLALLAAAPASADSDQDFTLVNHTGRPIRAVLLSPASRDHWGEDMLGAETLSDGAEADIEFPAGTRGCTWDLRVTYGTDETAEWHGLGLCNIDQVTLSRDASGAVRVRVE